MANGLYLIFFVGRDGSYGTGTLALMNGQVVGVDATGAEYVGTYQDQNNTAAGEITLNVPAGVALVTGAPASPQPYSVRFPFSIPSNMNENQVTQITVQLPTGPVNANVKKVKSLTV